MMAYKLGIKINLSKLVKPQGLLRLIRTEVMVIGLIRGLYFPKLRVGVMTWCAHIDYGISISCTQGLIGLRQQRCYPKQ